MAATITKQTFDDIKNKIFEIEFIPDQFSTCELIEVKGVNSHTLSKGQTQPFALLFKTQDNTVHEQNTYLIKNDELKEMPLFLVPIASDEDGVRYEAVFT